MISVLSPALRMHATGEPPLSDPVFLQQAISLYDRLRTLSPRQLEDALAIKAEHALRAYDTMRRISKETTGVAAAFGYYGLCYSALDPQSFTLEQRRFMQEHLRIVSAMYGLLRPLDNMLPHRLEMQTKGVPGVPDLYAFWGDKLCCSLFEHTDCVTLLCSKEYEKAILPHVKRGQKAIRCEFLIPDKGRLLMKPTQVKTARGLMARHIVTNRIDDPEGLLSFEEDGYAFAPYRSSRDLFVFIKSPYKG